MIFTQIELSGVFIIEPEQIEDERGFFARIFCKREFEARGLITNFVQSSISFNKKKGTLRGMHYQIPPKAETKLIRCTQGAVYDVIIDLRPGSSTYCKWTAVELNASNRKILYIPEGFAHGFQTLKDDTEVLYQMSEFYAPEYSRGIRWDDPAFGIKWPLSVSIISQRDKNYCLMDPEVV